MPTDDSKLEPSRSSAVREQSGLEAVKSSTAAADRALGVRAIVVYKIAKACVELGLFLVLAALWPFGLAEHLSGFARGLTEHGNHAWSLALARWVQAAVSAHGIELAMCALMFDGVLTGVEAWALASGRWWGPWLVVVSTASLLPFEVYEFVRQPRASRIALFAVNLAIVVYLSGHAWRAHRPDVRSARGD